MRYFLRDGAEAIRIRAGRSETAACGRQVFTDPKTGEQWSDFFYCWFGFRGPRWSGLVRYPLPDADVLLAVCRDSEDPDEVAAASLFLDESVDTRWRASWIWWNFCLSSRRVVRESRFSSTMACLRSRQVIVQALP